MGYQVRIHVELFPKCRFRVCFLGSHKNSKCLEHLRDLRARYPGAELCFAGALAFQADPLVITSTEVCPSSYLKLVT